MKRKKTSRHEPPQRLEWPTQGLKSCGSSSGSKTRSLESVSPPQKNSRISHKSSKPASSSFASKRHSPVRKGLEKMEKCDNPDVTTANKSTLWVDKHTPLHDSKELCVQPRKVQEVREWLRKASSGTSLCKMAVLVGNPGIGKSTLCRVLAEELGLLISQWNDSHFTVKSGGAENGNLLCLPYQSQLTSFEDFLQSAGAGFHTLSITSSSSPLCIGGVKSPIKRDRKGADIGGGLKRGSLILIEEIPNLHTIDAGEKFRTIMTSHILQTNIPTILIYSNVSEGKVNPGELEKLIDPSILYSPAQHVTVIQCNDVTNRMMKKCLASILKKESLKPISNDVYETIYTSSGGDMRNAIMSLQFQQATCLKKTIFSSKNKIKTDDQGCSSTRDVKLSGFHALGKLLYAKRIPKPPTESLLKPLKCIDDRPPLSFVPEDVMNKSEMDSGIALSFLSFHSPDFFMDETELSKAFDLFSDAELFLARTMDPQRDHSDPLFPSQYISSIAGRAVAHANKHPAPSRFRPLKAPDVLDVMRRKRANDMTMIRLRRQLSVMGGCDDSSSSPLFLGASVGSSDRFVMDCVPYLRTIIPHEVNDTLDGLHSFAKQPENDNKHAPGQRNKPKNDSFLRNDIIRKEQQQQLLKEDDILDYSDDDLIDLSEQPILEQISNGTTQQHPCNDELSPSPSPPYSHYDTTISSSCIKIANDAVPKKCEVIVIDV